MKLTLRFAHIWWAGFKVFCRWCVFGIVMWVLGLPIVGLAYLLGPDSIPSIVITLLMLPIPFYLTSKYLRLLEDTSVVVARAAEGVTEAGGRRAYDLGTKILISTVIVAVSSVIYVPSADPLSMLLVGGLAALLCLIALLILSQFRFMKAASGHKQTLVCVLVCLAAMLAGLGYVVLWRAYRHAHASPDAPIVSVSPAR